MVENGGYDRRAFLVQVLREFQAAAPGVSERATAADKNYVKLRTRFDGITFTWAFPGDAPHRGMFQVELSLEHSSAAENDRVFRGLRRESAAIQSDIGTETVEWEYKRGRKAQRISIYHPLPQRPTLGELSALKRWGVTTQHRFWRVMTPRLAALRSEPPCHGGPLSDEGRSRRQIDTLDARQATRRPATAAERLAAGVRSPESAARHPAFGPAVSSGVSGRETSPVEPVGAVGAGELLLRIARCPIVAATFAGQQTPCEEIVRSQGTLSLSGFHVPQPWAGDLVRAPLLFVSSNPSFNADEDFARAAWPDQRITDYFHRHFDPSAGWSRLDHLRQSDGTWGKPIEFWKRIRERAEELYQRPVRLGVDLAMTEVVRCKSKGEEGVAQALSVCKRLYLMRTLELSGAGIVVVMGKKARRAIEDALPGCFGVGDVGPPLTLGSRERIFVYLAHQSPRSPEWGKTFADRVPNELARLRAHLKGIPS